MNLEGQGVLPFSAAGFHPLPWFVLVRSLPRYDHLSTGRKCIAI